MPRLSIWMVRSALLYLGVGFTFGGVMLFHKGIPIDPGFAVWRLWPLHIEFTLIGWTVQLVMGVAFWILPRWQRPHRFGNPAPAWVAFGLINAGVLLVAGAAWFSWPQGVTLAGRVLELAAVVAFARYIWPRVKPPGGR